MWKFIISTAYGYLAVVWIICTLCRLGQISTLNVQSNNHNRDSESMWRNVSRSVCGGCSWQWRCPWAPGDRRPAIQQWVLSMSHLGLAAAWFYRYTPWAVKLPCSLRRSPHRGWMRVWDFHTPGRKGKSWPVAWDFQGWWGGGKVGW